MGGAVTVDRRDKDMQSFFVGDKLLKGEMIMKRNSLARVKFVEYIKSGAWSEHLSHFEDILLARCSHDSSVWSKFGYKSPKCVSPTRRFLSKSSRTTSDRSVDFSVVETESTSGSMYHKMVLEEFYATFSSSNLFKADELRAVLFAALLPIYMSSPDYRQSKDTWMVRSDTAATLMLESLDRTPSRRRSEHLQDWLLGAAAMCDSFQLEEHLADPQGSWIGDYKKILGNLPVTIYLSRVDEEEVESKVVYCNSVDKVLFRERTAIGSNLHDIFSLRCSAYEVELVHRAVFGGKHLKLCIMTDTCTLRALKPVFCPEGKMKYMIGIESQPFAYPMNPESIVCDQPFQQVEDLLALLPLLVKFPAFNKYPM